MDDFFQVTAHEIEKLIADGVLTESDLDSRALNALKEFDVAHIKAVIQEVTMIVTESYIFGKLLTQLCLSPAIRLLQFSSSDLSHVQNKSAYLCGMMKTYRQRLSMKAGNPPSTGPLVGPTEEQLADILKDGYTLDITTGQRKYGGPPPNWEGSLPGNGHEVSFQVTGTVIP